MKRFSGIMPILLVMVMAVGCGGPQQQARESAEQAFPALKERFMAQENYSFYGRTKLLSDNTTNGNYVNFSGQKQADDVFMQVKLSFPEKQRAETISMLSKGQQLFAKLDGDMAWREASNDHSLLQEFNNWSPEYSFRQMEEMGRRIVTEPDNNPNDTIKTFKVHLDSVKLKTWLADQMRRQTTGSRVQSTRTHVPKLKVAMRLSDGAWRHQALGTDGSQIMQTPASRDQNIDDIIKHMQVDAAYTVSYDMSRMLPTYVVMSIRSVYDLQGKRVHEYSQVETFFRNYGQQLPMPQM